MMQVRCQRCGWMFTFSRDTIGLALAEAQAKNEQYHAINCPQCRHVIKLQLKELRRRLPADYVLPEWTPPTPEEPQEKPDDKAETKPKAKKTTAKKAQK